MATNNVANATTAPDRLGLLLPWLNGHQLSKRDILSRVMQFASSPVGGELVGFQAVQAEQMAAGRISHQQLARIRRDLLALLEDVAAPKAGRTRRWPSRLWRLSSLRFTAASSGRDPQKLSTLKSQERRDYLGAGAYLMWVSGRLRDVLVYTVMRTLTEPGAVALARCPAPSLDDRSRPCGSWLIAIGARRGRPGTYCSDACRVRTWKEKE